MKRNELRIGNWISDQGYETTVFQIDETHVNDDLMLDHFKPIPLTEEWLVRFGFEEIIILDYKSGNYSKWANYFGILISIPNFELQVEDDEDLIFIRKIEYVHELQNLYFALTGEELELK